MATGTKSDIRGLDEARSSGGGDRRHGVLIVGAGFGGLAAAKALRRAALDVTVVDRANHHLFQPLLYQVTTGVLSEGDIAPPTRDVLRHQANTRVLLGDVVDMDLDGRSVVLSSFGTVRTVPYDTLIVAAGATTSYFGHDEFARHAPGMKTIDDALELRGRIFGAFERAELEARPETRLADLTFAVVGAGPTGVELAGQMAELAHRALKKNFRTFDPATARVVLVEASDRILPSFPQRLQRRTRRDLERIGIEVRLETRVTSVDQCGLDYVTGDGSAGRIEARTKIWSAGVQGSPIGGILASQSGAQLDRGGRVAVLPDCTLPGRPEVFVIGDLMGLDGLPGVAEVAMQSGRHAAKTVIRRNRGSSDERPFRYRDLGTMATISRFRGVAFVGPVRLAGVVGWLAWLFVHLMFLTSFKNRISVLANWVVAFVGRGRRQRTATVQQVLARNLAAERSVTPVAEGSHGDA